MTRTRRPLGSNLPPCEPSTMRRMATLSVAVLGAGVTGLAAALALGRAGHAVTVIERDQLIEVMSSAVQA
jgi:NADPH-dependent 2,4-dienoyl-CoA reductase/sulfur reductase-like enzyme